MPMTDAYSAYLAKISLGEADAAFDNSGAHIAVGDSATAFSAAQTDLQAGANKLRKAMEATYPQRSANVLTLRALFGTAEANWAWNEWAVFNAAFGGTMMNRKVEALGTKTAAQSWQLTITNTLNAA